MGATMRSVVCLAGLALVSSIAGIVGFYHGERPSDGMVALAAAHEPSEMNTPSESSTAALQDNAEPACLDCHGPFEDLAKKAPTFKTDENGLINPHRYVPHKTKEVPECTNCHVQHPVPPTETVKKPDKLKWCYNACHHQQNFTPCSKCHIDKG